MAAAVAKVAFWQRVGHERQRLIGGLGGSDVEVVLVASNRAKAGVLDRADRLGIPTWTFRRTDGVGRGDGPVAGIGVPFVALAGFLMKVPDGLVAAFSDNAEPSLPPCCRLSAARACRQHVRAVHAALVAGRSTARAYPALGGCRVRHGGHLLPAEPLVDSDTPATAEKVRQLEAEHYAPQTLRAIRESLSLPDPAAG